MNLSVSEDILLTAVFSTMMSDGVCQPIEFWNKEKCYCKPLSLWEFVVAIVENEDTFYQLFVI